MLLRLLGAVLLPEVEHMNLYLGAEIVAYGELLEFLSQHVGRHAVHLQYARGVRRAVGGDSQQGMGRRDAACGAGLLAQGVAERAEEILRLLGLARSGGGQFMLEAQAYLVYFPIFEACGEQLVGQRSLFAQKLQREVILQRVGDTRLGRVERCPGQYGFERLRNLGLHIASFLIRKNNGAADSFSISDFFGYSYDALCEEKRE